MSDRVSIRQSKQKSEMVEQLKTTPIVQIACSKCGIARSSFYRWVKDDPGFAEQVDVSVEEGTNIINDLAESQLITFIKDGNLSAIFYWLNHRHNKYSTKLELTTRNGDKELTPEQEESIKNALALASLINLNNEESK